jgi:hypothetical protein
MTTNQPLSLFISSKMGELAPERRALKDGLEDLAHNGLIAWIWEDDAGARPKSVRSTYLKEVEACDLYIGIFWLGYGPSTIEEYRHARRYNQPCLVYEKHVDVGRRSPELVAFLNEIEQATNPEGLTVCRFTTPAELVSFVRRDVLHLLTTTFRESRRQPASRQVPHKREKRVSAKDHSFAIGGDNIGPISQNNY